MEPRNRFHAAEHRTCIAASGALSSWTSRRRTPFVTSERQPAEVDVIAPCERGSVGEHERARDRQRSRGDGGGCEVDRGQKAVAAVLAEPGEHVGPASSERCAPVWSAGVAARSAARRRTRLSVEPGSPAWRSTQRRSASATSGSHGSPVREAGARPGRRRRLHGIGARSGSRPSTSTTRSGGIVGVRQPELVALVDERRAAQGVQHQQPRARAPGRGRRVAAGDARVVVVAQEPRRPGGGRGERLEVVDRARGSAAALHGRSRKTKLCARCSWSPLLR